MEGFRNIQKKYCSKALMLSIIVCLFCVAMEQVAIGKGLILGCLFSILNFILMGEILPFKLDKSKKAIFFISLGSIFFRYILLAIPLVFAIKLESFNLFSVIVGIFAVQIVLFSDHMLRLIGSAYRKKI